MKLYRISFSSLLVALVALQQSYAMQLIESDVYNNIFEQHLIYLENNCKNESKNPVLQPNLDLNNCQSCCSLYSPFHLIEFDNSFEYINSFSIKTADFPVEPFIEAVLNNNYLNECHLFINYKDDILLKNEQLLI